MTEQQHKHQWHMWIQPGQKPEVIANSPCAICGLTPEAVANAAGVKEAIAEAVRTGRENAALRAIVEEVAAVSWSEYCPWCRRHGTMHEVEHDDDCPVLAARALTGVMPDGEDDD